MINYHYKWFSVYYIQYESEALECEPSEQVKNGKPQSESPILEEKSALLAYY